MSKYENHNLEYSELPFIYNEGYTKPTKHMFGSSNWHENIEIIYIKRGRGEISDNSRVLSVSEGDVVVINSNHLHALASGDESMSYSYLIVDRAFCLSNGFDSTDISFSCKLKDERVSTLFETLDEIYFGGKCDEYKVLRVRTAVLQILLILCQEYSTPLSVRDHQTKSSSYVKSAIDYIRASYDKDFSLLEVAEFVGINKCYLSREFHRYTGYTFVAYVNLVRCKKAKQLLLDERLNVRDVGIRCGFENSSYFTRSFRRYFGVTPNEYRIFIKKEKPTASV